MRVTPVEQSAMGQKMCFSDSYVIFGMRIKFFNNLHYFSQKTQNSLFPQCKTSIANGVSRDPSPGRGWSASAPALLYCYYEIVHKVRIQKNQLATDRN